MPTEPLALALLGHGVVDPGRPWLAVDDDAVLRGRAAFETLRVYDRRPFRLQSHLSRLRRSAAVLDLPEVDTDGLAALATDAVAAAAEPESVLRLVWTPGRPGGSPTGFALVTALPADLDETRARGVALVSLQLAIGANARSESRWLLPGVKSTSYAVNIAAQREAHRRHADDAVLLSLEETVLECPTSNIWFREGDVVLTPSLDLGILAGVTREALLEAAAGAGTVVEEGAFPVSRLAAADEVFVSSSVREVMPVVSLDGRPVAGGAAGPAATAMQQALRRLATAG